PLAVIFAFCRMLLFKFYSRVYYKPIFNTTDNITVVLSLLNHQSFTKDGTYYDAYFGDFVNYLKRKKVPFLNLLIVITPLYKTILKKTYSQLNILPFVTIEYFLSFFDLLKCLFWSLIKYFSPIKLKGNTSIDGIDLIYLLKVVIRKDYISTYFYDNLRIFYAVKSLIKKIKIDRFYYPFENRSFEKMIILALRKFSPQTKIIGYQHASLSLRHTNFLLTKEEAKITPFPDLIITMGEITRNIMIEVGNFPSILVKTGCALRQANFNGELKKKSSRISNLFVALATGIEEYVKVLKFLEQAFSKENQYNIWIRPHPVFSLEEAIDLIGGVKLKFHKANKESLEECYSWADILLYVHSTLSIEALLRGIPVINIAIESILEPDPLFNFDDFKWRVDQAEELLSVIESISLLNEKDFLRRQYAGREYAKRYIYEVNAQRLEEFLQC
ncbi:MAG: hypothetical protein NC817_01685, partial [Candidatus Omnitrophica bacterium]|nr:hypothetical protein [Candidatus Omnitrophota bacterium]